MLFAASVLLGSLRPVSKSTVGCIAKRRHCVIFWETLPLRGVLIEVSIKSGRLLWPVASLMALIGVNLRGARMCVCGGHVAKDWVGEYLVQTEAISCLRRLSKVSTPIVIGVRGMV